MREYTALAPLGAADARIGGAKQTGQPLKAIAAALVHDVVEGAHGRGGYFISADIAPERFADDCVFVDPTNSVASLARYTKALTLLFEPSLSTVALVEGPDIDEAARTIRARVRSAGVLRFPWRPRIAPYESEVLWRIGADGLVRAQEQTWSISPADALRQTFTPDLRAMTARRGADE